MGYTKSNPKKKTNNKNKNTKTKQNKTYWLHLGRVSLLKGDDMFDGQGWPLFGPPVIFTPTCAACITSYVQNPFNFEPYILPSGPREICLGPKYNFQSFKSPFKWEKRGEEEGRRRKKKKEEEEEEFKAFAMIKKMNQYISPSPGSTTCKTTYNNWIDA